MADELRRPANRNWPGKLGILGRYADHHRAGSRAFENCEEISSTSLRAGSGSFTRLRLAV